MMDADNSESSSDSEDLHASDTIITSSNYDSVALVAGHNKWEWTFLTCAILSSITLMTSAVVIKNCPEEDIRCNHCIWLEILIITVAAIALIFAVYGVLYERQYDIYSHCIWMIVALHCSWLSYTLRSGDMYIVKLVINSVVSGLCVISIILAIKATHVPDWIEFRLIGVSDPMAAMYKNQCYFLAVLKFYCIFINTMASLYSPHDCSQWLPYQGVIIIFSMLMWIFGKLVVKKENNCLVYGFYCVNSCFLVSVIYMVYFFYLDRFTGANLDPSGIKILIISVELVVVMVASGIYVMVQMWKVEKAFGYGLNSKSFCDLVSRNSSNLLANDRSALLF